MSDDSTAGWTPPQQAEPAGGDVPVTPGPPTIDTPPATDAPITGDSPVIPASPPPPPPPAWSPQSGGDDRGDGGGGSDSGEGGGKSKKVLIGAVVGVLAIGAAGVFAVTQMTGGNEGGAASPEELGDAVMESLDQEDFLGVIDLLLPGERDTFSEPAQELVSELDAARGAQRGRLAHRSVAGSTSPWKIAASTSRARTSTTSSTSR